MRILPQPQDNVRSLWIPPLSYRSYKFCLWSSLGCQTIWNGRKQFKNLNEEWQIHDNDEAKITNVSSRHLTATGDGKVSRALDENRTRKMALKMKIILNLNIFGKIHCILFALFCFYARNRIQRLLSWRSTDNYS